jgi:hypothetical protein
MSSDANVENARASFTEACNLARHYSTLRFVMFSVFITITGALVTVEFDSGRRPADGLPLILFRMASLFLVLCFALSEWRIGQLVVFYQTKTYEFGSNCGHSELSVAKPMGNQFWRIAAPLLTIIPFCLVAILWLVALIFFCGAPLWSAPTPQH